MMRKQIIGQAPQESRNQEHQWLDLEQLAQVEVTSEDAAHSIESALIPGSGLGWRAGEPGSQTIRLIFDEPRSINHIHLLFGNPSGSTRTQEFVLRWSPGAGEPYREIVRQQYNFNSSDVNPEVEDYAVHLGGVATIELVIIPDISGGNTRASLEQMRVA